MSDQSQPLAQSSQSPEELRQLMLEQLDTSKQAIEELSDEELEFIAGGGLSSLVKAIPTEVKVASAVVSVSGSLVSLSLTVGRNKSPYKYRTGG